MDQDKIIEALRATLEPSFREQAEAFLTEVQKIISFVPQLLHIVTNSKIDVSIRQAGAIYMKNMITQSWSEEDEAKPGQPVPFSIHENDKQVIRDKIVEAVIDQRDLIRVQLAACVSTMVKNDYPRRWPGIAETIVRHFKSTDYERRMGSLICLYQLVKHFEMFDSKVLKKVMLNNNIISTMHSLCIEMLPDSSKKAAYHQKQILKIFFALTRFHLPMDLITRDTFAQWMDLTKKIIELPVPAECDNIEESGRGALVWKCKKWAVKLVNSCFKRYGSPGKVLEEYNYFAKWFLKNCAVDCMNVMLMVLDCYVMKQFVSQSVLQFSLKYINTGINYATTWKCLKPYMPVLIKRVIFPLFGQSEEDQKLWQDDPVEFIKVKYDIFEEFLSATTAAESLLVDVVSKRKETLQMAMSWADSVISSEDPKIRDQALHMIGVLGDVLLKKKLYKNQVEDMMKIHVFQHFSSPHGFLRARACWMVNMLCKTKFKDAANVQFITESLINMLNKDQELPVRVGAVIGLKKMLAEQSKAKEIMLPHIQQIFRDLLKLTRVLKTIIVFNCFQDFVDKFAEEVKPLAFELTSHLGQTFAAVIESSGASSEDESFIAMGLLNTLETICHVLEDQKEVLCCIEGIIIEVIGVILKNNVSECFVEMVSLISTLTKSQVTQQMWTALPIIYVLFKRDDNIEYFTHVMPALYNYITVDSKAFLADQSRMENMFDMAKMVLNAKLGYAGEEAESHAAKLLEIMLLQFKDIPELVCKMMPLFLELMLSRLSRPIQSLDLKLMCLQVVLAAMFINPLLTLAYLAEVDLPNEEGAMVRKFLGQVLQNADYLVGIHDRKMFVLGICSLMSLPDDVRPANIEDLAAKFLPSLIIIFKGIKKTYKWKSHREELENEDEEDVIDEDDVEEWEDEEDVIDKDDVEELDNEDEEDLIDKDDFEELGNEDEEDLIDKDDFEELDNEDEEDLIHQDDVEELGNEDEDGSKEEDFGNGDDDYDALVECGETLLDRYGTLVDGEDSPVDEYQMFMTVFERISNVNSLWYQVLTRKLVEDDHKQLEEIFRLAEQRKAAQESKKIEQARKYNFTITQVPSTF